MSDFVFDDTPINGALVKDLAAGGFITQQRNIVPTMARNEWVPVANWWRAVVDVIKVISGFTLSHSVTLSHWRPAG